MPDNAVDQAALAGSAPVHDLSVVTLFLQADIVVKVVMLLLLVASFWSWAVIFDKYIKLRRLRRDADEFEEAFWSGGALDDLYDRIGSRPEDPMSSVFAAAMREWRRSMAKGLAGSSAARTSLQERIERVMQVTAAARWSGSERCMAVPRDGRLDRALRRPLRHGLGHHEQLRGDRGGARTPASPSSRPASPRRCSRPRSASSPRSRR